MASSTAIDIPSPSPNASCLTHLELCNPSDSERVVSFVCVLGSQRNTRLMELESSRPVAVRTLAHFARRNLADKLRKQGAGQAVTALLGGWDEVRAKANVCAGATVYAGTGAQPARSLSRCVCWVASCPLVEAELLRCMCAARLIQQQFLCRLGFRLRKHGLRISLLRGEDRCVLVGTARIFCPWRLRR